MDKNAERCKAATLDDILVAREHRAKRQRELRERYKCTLISFTLNIPGERKLSPLVERAFFVGVAEIDRILLEEKIPVLYREEKLSLTGPEAFFVVNKSAKQIKTNAMKIEQEHPLGRVFDVDVIDEAGDILKGDSLGRQSRECIVCGEPVWECIKLSRHDMAEPTAKVNEMLVRYFSEKYAEDIAEKAVRALLSELNTTPKPGLVDRENSGAHDDMDFGLFLASANSLRPFFALIAKKGFLYSGDISGFLGSVRSDGIVAEQEMLEVTGGVNTHKGAIFSLGTLCAAAGMLYKAGNDFGVEDILGISGEIARETVHELCKTGKETHGKSVYFRYGVSGARGEVAAGFPNAYHHGYQHLLKRREEGWDMNDAGVYTLLSLLSHVDDTNILYRSDKKRSLTSKSGLVYF